MHLLKSSFRLFPGAPPHHRHLFVHTCIFLYLTISILCSRLSLTSFYFSRLHIFSNDSASSPLHMLTTPSFPQANCDCIINYRITDPSNLNKNSPPAPPPAQQPSSTASMSALYRTATMIHLQLGDCSYISSVGIRLDQMSWIMVVNSTCWFRLVSECRFCFVWCEAVVVIG